MATIDLEELYTRQIKPLPAADRRRLIALLLRDLAHDDDTEQMTIEAHLAAANYQGGELFKTAEEVDDYIRAERDAWER
jgi:hypothetical protein